MYTVSSGSSLYIFRSNYWCKLYWQHSHPWFWGHGASGHPSRSSRLFLGSLLALCASYPIRTFWIPWQDQCSQHSCSLSWKATSRGIVRATRGYNITRQHLEIRACSKVSPRWVYPHSKCWHWNREIKRSVSKHFDPQNASLCKDVSTTISFIRCWIFSLFIRLGGGGGTQIRTQEEL